jgi:hypothetical protein
MLQIRQDVEDEDRALTDQFNTQDGALLIRLLSQIS